MSKNRILTVMLAFNLLACAHPPGASSAKTSSSAEESVLVESKESPCLAYNFKPTPKDFKGFDVDGDGKVSKVEYMCMVVKVFDASDKNADFYLDPAELKHRAKAWQKAGRNKNKKISIIEFMKVAEEVFKKADKNRDDKLDIKEFKKANP